MTLIIKAILVLLLIFIAYALGSALYYLITDRDQTDRMAKALTWRIGLSLVLFVLLMLAYAMGWITPHRVL